MDSLLNSMSASQALEWELFAAKNPSFEDKVLIQMAYIAQIFASAFIKKKDKAPWKLAEFMPFENKKPKEKPNSKSLLKKLVLLAGDKKTKKKFLDEEPVKKVLGTDGKLYNYALEEFATRTSKPKRMTSKKRMALVEQASKEVKKDKKAKKFVKPLKPRKNKG